MLASYLLAEVDPVVIGFFAIIAVVVAIVIAGTIARSRAASAQMDIVMARTDFDAADVFVSAMDQNGLAIDRTGERLLLVSVGIQRVVPAPDVISVEILADDTSLVCTNRGSQVAGAAIGGILLGPVGLLIGGLSGSKRSENLIKSIRLRIVTADFAQPNHDILMFQSISSKGEKRDSIRLTKPLQTAEIWHARVTALIRASTARIDSPQVSNQTSLADELRKLDDLRRDGVLTEEEFAASKRNLLDAGGS